MNLLELDPYQIINRQELNDTFILEYQLTLPHYYVYQLLTMIQQKHPYEELTVYFDRLFLKKEENDDFRHGVIDAFCEVVKAGVKKIAFSHATDDLALFASDLHHAYACAKKYGISFYIEENLFETCLFHNSGSHVIIFYSDSKDLEAYLTLKKMVLENKNPTDEQAICYAQMLGRLLSYSEKRIGEMIHLYQHQ